MNRFVFSSLFAIFLTFFVLPRNAAAQQEDPYKTPGFNWDEITFQDDPSLGMINRDSLSIRFEEDVRGPYKRVLWTPNAEYERGSSEGTNRMRKAFQADSTVLIDLFDRADAIRCEGTNNFVTNNQQSEPPQTAANPPASHTTADADLAETRSHTCESMLSEDILGTEFNFTKIDNGAVSVPDKLQNLKERPKNLSDIQELLARKSFVVIFDIYNEDGHMPSLSERHKRQIEDNQERISALASRVDSLGEEHRWTRAMADSALAAASAAKDSAAAAQQTANKAAESNQPGPELGAFVGAGGERFAGINALVGEVGLRLGDAEAIGWYGRKQNVGTADLQDGPVTIHRETYGLGLNWYPVEFLHNRFEIGPSIAFEHGEDYLDGREMYVRGYESGQLGVAVNARLIGPISLHGGVRYLIAQNFESTDLQLDHENSKIRAGITLRITF